MAGGEPVEACELCGNPIPSEHRHLLDMRTRELMCTCQACRILFDSGAAGGGHYRLVPERRLRIDGFELDDVTWEELRLPVDMVFFFHHSGEGKVVAYYPSPAGPTESLLELGLWAQLERANPVLGQLEPDVEALLVNRTHDARQYFLVPIEDCYSLVGLMRTRWRGFTGGRELWQGINEFFESLEEETAWQG